MKPFAIVIRATLAALLLLGGAAAAQEAPKAQEAPAGAKPRKRVAQFDAAEAALLRRLATPEAARAFRQYNAAGGQLIQQHLAVIYAADRDFKSDAGAGGRPLGDSIVGPVTLKWLTRFCRDYGIVATEPAFERVVTTSLEQVASIARAHPDWQAILASEDFDEWINGQPTPRRVESLKMRRSGAASQVNALIEQYLKSKGEPAVVAAPAAPVDVTYGYDPKRLTRIENLGLIVEGLKPLVDRGLEDEEGFDEELQVALDGLTVQADTLGLIKRYSQVEAYQVTPALLHRLRKDGMPEAAVMELKAQLGAQEYDNTQEFQAALSELADASEYREAIERSRRNILRAARVARYRVPASIMDDLAEQPLAPPVAAVFAGIRSVEYPTRELFEKALEWQVRRALDMCRDPGRLPQGALGDADFDALVAMLPKHAEVFKRIRALRAPRDVACSSAELADADALAYESYRFLSARLDHKVDLAVRNAMPAPKVRETSWAVPWCRCGRDPVNGIAYGFYPLWTDAGEKQIDFGVLSRIGLYGLTADRKGELRGPQGMHGSDVPAAIVAMMRAAHSHHVGVDWVVSRNDWSDWVHLRRAQKEAVLETLEAQIAELLARPLPGGRQTLWRMASLGADSGATGGDGVALYFRSFPVADKALYNAFVLRLSARLKKMQPARRLSIIADQAELATSGPIGLANLVGLVELENWIPKDTRSAGRWDLMEDDMPVLVMLTEATRDSKKALRGLIQETLRGTESARLLRTIVPVLEYDRVGSEQLADDIVYASDNYAGIGFWPLHFAEEDEPDGSSPADTRSLNRLLALKFQPYGTHSERWNGYFANLCPYRLELRWLFWISLAAATVVGGVYFNCRGCNERVDSSGLYFAGMMALLALPLVTLAVLVLSDPLLAPYFHVALVLYGTGGIVAAALVARYYFNKSRRKLP